MREPREPAASLRFLLDGGRVERVRAARTVFQCLREDLRGTHTKEGCAERDSPGLRYCAVNSCIQFAPALDGKALLTVADAVASVAKRHSDPRLGAPATHEAILMAVEDVKARAG